MGEIRNGKVIRSARFRQVLRGVRGIILSMKKKIQAARPQQKIKMNKDNEKSAVQLEIRVGYASCAATEISGDAVISCRLPEGRRALILSDGMGKGIKAAAGSRLVVSRLRKNLKEGMKVADAIKEVNRYMLIHGGAKGEDFATVDLTIIDPVIKKARFYKMGAATSFIVRNGRVRRIAKEALPVGIIPSLRLSHISAGLRPGDIILMVSDGITEADRSDLNAGWLEIYLMDFSRNLTCADAAAMSARHLAADILNRAVSIYGTRERDDLTVAAVIIADNGAHI